ncbi:MAG: DUF1365 family protein [Methyloceanibacter sp.]|nr:DUF1365 family protein [Methyloceanibacter sp.]
MSTSALYNGVVVHKRVRPVQHSLRYHVFSLLVDCDELPDLGRRLRLFSYNHLNLCSIHDADHGDGTPISDYLRQISAQSCVKGVERFMMLCYPRVLGYVFNPVTIYFGVDADGEPLLIVYEVNNTFGERQTYVVPVEQDNRSDIVHQSCAKAFYVSPFNSADGRYSFHVTPLGEEITVGIALHTEDGPLLKAFFRGERETLTDGTLAKALARTGWLSVKVISAIHYEALKLWLKGLRLMPRPRRPKSAIAYVSPPGEHGDQ